MEANGPMRIDTAEVDRLIQDLEKQARKNLAYGHVPVKNRPDVIAYALVDIPFKSTRTRTSPVSVYVRIVDRQPSFVALYDLVKDEIDIPVVVGKTADFSGIRTALLHELVHAADPNIHHSSHRGMVSIPSFNRRARRLSKQGLPPMKSVLRYGVGRVEVRAHMAETVVAISPAIEKTLVRIAQFGQTITTKQYNDIFRAALEESKTTWPFLAKSTRDFDKEFAEFVKGVWQGVERELSLWKAEDGRTLKEVVISDDRKMSDFDMEMAKALSGRREVSLGAMEATAAKRRARR